MGMLEYCNSARYTHFYRQLQLLVHYSESPTLVPLQILRNAQLAIVYYPMQYTGRRG